MITAPAIMTVCSALSGSCPRACGKRCILCYELRLRRTAEEAVKGGYDYFTTTLTISPLKDAQVLNRLGQKLAAEYGVKYLPSDFKKNGGYQRSIELSKEYGLYRQNYCGCEYSLKQRTNFEKNRQIRE